MEALGLSENKLVNISTAVDSVFKPVDYTQDEIQLLRKSYGLERKIVMYAPGGFDMRKNFEGLIQAG